MAEPAHGSTYAGIFRRVFLDLDSMPSNGKDKRAAAQAGWREMARGMRKFIAIQTERAVEDGTPRDASLVYIKARSVSQSPTRPVGSAWKAAASAHHGRVRRVDEHRRRDAMTARARQAKKGVSSKELSCGRPPVVVR